VAQPHRTNPADPDPWGIAYKRLVLWSIKRFGISSHDAEDLVQEGMKQFIAAGGTADGDLGQLLKGVGSRINGVRNNNVRKKASTAVRLTADGTLPDGEVSRHAEDQIAEVEMSRKALGLLIERVQDDDLLFAVVAHISEGKEEPADLAVALGVDRKDVYNARRRLNGHVVAVKARMEES
jgi:hypothetical protein